MQEDFEKATVYKDKVYGCLCTDKGLRLSIVDLAENESKIEYDICELSEIIGISIGSNDDIFLFGKKEEQVELCQIDHTGKLVREKELGIEDSYFDARIRGFYIDQQGLYYLWYETDVMCTDVYENGEEGIHTLVDRIYVFDNDMNQICYEQVPNSYGNRLICFFLDEKDEPRIIAKNEEGYYSKRVRQKVGEDSEKTRIEDDVIFKNIESSENVSTYNNELIYVSDEKIHAYSLSENRDRIVLSLAEGGIYGADIICLHAEKDRYEIINLYRKTGKLEYTEFVKSNIEQKQLTLGCFYCDDRINDAVTDFNHSQNKLRVTIKTYQDFDGGTSQLDKFKLELLSGEGPDLICTDLIDYETLAGHGVFVDLYELMQNSGGISKDKLVSQAVRPYEIDGQLFALGPRFSIYTMWGPKSIVEGRQSADLDELREILINHGGGLGNIWGLDTADESILSTLLAISLDEFVDWENGTCDFDKPGFSDLLEFANKFKPIDYGKSLYLAKKKRVILLEYGVINSVYDVTLQTRMFGEEIDFIGYPTKRGTGISVGICGNIGINAKSDKREDAWDFLQYYICQNRNSIGFPITRDEFEEMLDASTKEERLRSNNEEYSEIQQSYFEKDVISIDIFKSEQADVESIRRLVDRISAKYEYHVNIQDIIEEEAEHYFRGSKSLNEVTKVIQSRISLYLQERN